MTYKAGKNYRVLYKSNGYYKPDKYSFVILSITKKKVQTWQGILTNTNFCPPSQQKPILLDTSVRYTSLMPHWFGSYIGRA